MLQNSIPPPEISRVDLRQWDLFGGAPIAPPSKPAPDYATQPRPTSNTITVLVSPSPEKGAAIDWIHKQIASMAQGQQSKSNAAAGDTGSMAAKSATAVVVARPVTDDIDGDEEDEKIVDLDNFAIEDTPETILAKLMFKRMMHDIKGDIEAEAEPDLFGEMSHVHSKANRAETFRLDALIWMYSFNPESALVPFEWVCDTLSINVERVRHIAARSVRHDLKRIIQILASTIGQEHALLCEERLADYVNLSGWQPKW